MDKYHKRMIIGAVIVAIIGMIWAVCAAIYPIPMAGVK